MATDGIVVLEAWGGEGGNPWSHKFIGDIAKIFITYGTNGVNSIQFTSKDGNGATHESEVFGVINGMTKEITIDSPVEKLVSIEGSVGTYNSLKRVTSLGFTTTKTKHQPVGNGNKESEFSCILSSNPFIGFHGNYTSVLNSIGIMTSVVTSMEVAAAQPVSDSGAPWEYTSKGPISQISVSYEDDIICSIQFTSRDADGVLHKSPLFGKSEDRKYLKEIEIDTSVEKIIGINGTFGPYKNVTLVKSLTFITDSRRSIGPFGVQIPQYTPFSFSVQGGNILAGFHGRSGWYIDSIGVFKQKVGSVKVGPFGSTSNASPWTYEPQGLISRIFGHQHGGFDVIQFESIDENGEKHTSEAFGTVRTIPYSVNTAKDDRVMGISGTQTLNKVLLCGVYIYTKKNTYGTYGNNQGGTKFSFKVKNGYISGFHGWSSKYGVHAMGIYVKPA